MCLLARPTGTPAALAFIAALLSGSAFAQGPSTCAISGTLLDGGGSPIANTEVRMRTVTPATSGAFGITSNDLKTKTASDGTWTLTMIQGLTAQVDIPAAGIAKDFTVPTGAQCPAAFTSITLHNRGSLTPATILSATGPSAGGDLAGAFPSPIVAGLRTQPLYAELCTNGQARVYDVATASFRCASIPTGTAVSSVTAGTGIVITGSSTAPVVGVSAIPEGSVTNLTTDLAAKLDKSGGTMTGTLTLAGAPAADLQAATRLYVDTGLAGKLATGGTIAESQVTNLVTDLAAKEATANKGQPSGYAALDGTGKVPTGQLPATMTPSAHATTHAAGNTDPVSPASIGASATGHGHVESDTTGLVADLASKAPLAGTNVWPGLQTFNGGIIVTGSQTIAGNVTAQAPYALAVSMATPSSLVASAAPGGSLPIGTYYYVVTALDGAGGQTLVSNEQSVGIGGLNGSSSLGWTASPGAVSYRIWRGTSAGNEDAYQTSATNSFLDTGAAGTGGTLPIANSALTVRMMAGTSWLLGGNVGIGKSTPATALDVNGTTTSTAFAGPLTGNVMGDVTGTASGNPPNARTISTTAPLAGGGDLSSNRTLTVSITPSNDGGAVALQAASPGTPQTGNANLSGTIIAGAGFTGNLTGNASGSAASFTGSLLGDVTGTQGATVVSTVGTSSASNVHSAELAANAATAVNTPSTILKRDGAGQVAATTFTGALAGNATTASDGLSSAAGTAPLTLSLGAKALTGSVATMTGASGGGDGARGVVPQPMTGDQAKCLKGDATWGPCGAGTVTSVGLSGPGDWTITNSPVTGTGTLTVAYASQTANKFLASPDGLSGAPSYRAMVSGDLPATIAANTSGTAASVTGSFVGDVTGTQGATVVSLVNGSTAANVHAAELAANAATDANTASRIVKRDVSGNFSAGTITANLTGNASGTAASITGNLAGDVTSVGMTTTVATVGGQTASNVAAGAVLANAATSANTLSAIVKRDGSGNFSAGTITANLTGNASGSAASFTGSLVGDVTGTQGATVVSTVAASSAANVHAAELLANAATNANTASTIVRRDASGNFAAGTITAGLTGNATTASDGLTSAAGTAPLTLNLAAKALTGSVAVATGASGIADGATGLVPKPVAGDNVKFLRGDMTYSAAGTGTVTSVATDATLTGGPITTTGTLAVAVPLPALATNSYKIPRVNLGETAMEYRTPAQTLTDIGGISAAYTLVGDVTGTPAASVVSAVAGSTAANVHAAELLANAATNANTASTIVKRDASGNFAAGAVTTSGITTTTAQFASVVDNGNSGATHTIDWTLGPRQKITTNASCVLTFTAPTGPTNLLLKIVHEASATAYTYTWPVAVKWQGGVAAVTTDTSGAVDLVSCFYDGVAYYCVGNANFQ